MSKQQTSEDLVTIATVAQHFEAYMLKALLEGEDIPVFLQDELFTQLYACLGGIKIQVPATDAEKAHKILVENGHTLN